MFPILYTINNEYLIAIFLVKLCILFIIYILSDVFVYRTGSGNNTNPSNIPNGKGPFASLRAKGGTHITFGLPRDENSNYTLASALSSDNKNDLLDAADL